MALQALLRRLRVAARAARQLARLLLQPLLGPLVVAEHRRIEVELDELADPPQLPLGVEHEVLELDLHVVAEVGLLGAAAEHPAAPALGGGLDRLRAEALLEDRERDVAAVADQVDEARLRQVQLDLAHVLDVARRLVTPARRPAVLLAIDLEELAHRRGTVELAPRLEHAPALESSSGSIWKSPQRRCEVEHLDHPLAACAVALPRLDQVGDEMRLRGDRDLGMRIEHQPQQRRPRARRADDERRRRRRRARAPDRAATAAPAARDESGRPHAAHPQLARARTPPRPAAASRTSSS